MKLGNSIAIIGLFIIFAFLNSAAYAQTPTPEPTLTPVSGFDPTLIADGLGNWAFWVTLLVTLVAGAVGGIVYELLILQGNLELPHRPAEEEVTEQYPYAIVKNLYDLGIWARVIIGALAAVAALLVLAPSTTFGLLATAVVAGSAGTSVFRSMQDRLSTAMALKEAADTRATADKQDAKVDEAREAFADLKGKLVETATSPPGAKALAFDTTAGAFLDLEDLDKVERLLNEAKGIHAAI